MKASPRVVLRVINVLIVVSLLLGAVAPVVGEGEHSDVIGERGSSHVGVESSVANILAVVDVSGPLTVAPDEQVTLQVRVVNVGVEPILGAQVQMREEPGAKIAGRSQQSLPDIPVGAQAVVEFNGKVVANPGELLDASFEVKGGSLDQEVLGHYRALVRQEVPDIWQPDPNEHLWQVGEYLEIELTGEYDPDLVEISHRVLYEENITDPNSVHQLELLAYNPLRQTLTHFSEPVIVRWHYMEALADSLPILPPLFAWWDPQVEAWQTLPTEANLEQGYIETQIHHPGRFRVEDGIGEAEEDPFSGLDSDLYTGAANYHYPLPLLQRPNGFAPGLALNYNSRRRDVHETFGSNGSLLGWGWRLDGLGRINWLGGNLHKMELNGITYTIDHSSELGWYAEEAPWLRITRAASGQGQPWFVRTPDGRRYGFDPMLEVLSCDDNGQRDKDIKTFMLTSITDTADDDVFNYSMNIAYETSERIFDLSYPCTKENYVFQALPNVITYNSISSGWVRIDFDYVDRTDKPQEQGCEDTQCGNVEDKLLYYYTKALNKITIMADGNIARAYEFTSSEHSGRWLLDSVQTLGKGGVAELPPTTFTYKNESACYDWGNCALESIDNGQGGTASLHYEQEGTSRYYHLVRMEIENEFGSTQTREMKYSGWEETPNGYRSAEATDVGDPDTTADDRISKHWFYNTGDEGSWGREYRTTQEKVDPSGFRLGRTERMFDTLPLPENSDYMNLRWVLEEQTDYAYDEAGANESLIAHTEYSYDLDHQGDHQNGNITHIREYLGDTTNLVRTTERKFYPTANDPDVPGPSIRNHLAEEWVWEGDVGNACKSYSRYYYDDQDYTVPPIKGLLSKVEGAETWCDSSGGDLVTLQTNTYEPTWNNLQRTEDALQHGVSYTYDNDFHAYVTNEKYDLAHEIATTYHPTDVVEQALGWPYQVTDVNEQVTTFEYDAYGRTLTIDRPLGDSEDESWVYYNYQSGIPRRVRHRVRDDVAGVGDYDNYLVTWTYTDGLGRTLQTQTEAEEAGQSIVQSYAYDQRGRLQRESMPYQQPNHDPGSSYLPVADWNSVDHTAYDYDPFSRIRAVTNPNATTVRSYYNYLSSAIIDENEHQTITTNDGFGRHIRTDQYDGEYTTPDWTSESYFHADYDYDVLDNLLVVTNRAGQPIVMQYDALSRKTDMSDPNMGDWSYGYDAVGNLTSQTDAQGCVTILDYDVLNRLTDKTYSGTGACATTLSVSYTYDEFDGAAQFGKGRRTGMSDGSGNTAWVYDQRGRVTGETKTIGTDVFTTGYGYDAADRMTEMTYPGSNNGGGGESVTYAYNNQGLLDSMNGNEAYVVSSSYDEAGRLTERVSQKYYTDPSPDSFWTTTYTYHPWDNPNLGRLWIINASGTGETGTETFQDLSYAYDPVGNVEVIGDNVSGQTRDFDYDALDRLTFSNASVGDGGGVYEEAYEYYRAGHFQRKWDPATDPDEAKCLTEPEADGCYKYEQGPRHAVSDYYVATDQANTYGYDANGNMTSRTVDGVNYTLTYDAENRLIGVSGGGPTVTFTYDGDGNRVKKDEGGVVTLYPSRHYEATVGSGSTKYYHADGQLIAFDRSADYDPEPWGTRYVFRDHLGSTSIVVNGRGLVLWEDRFLPFGDVRYTYRKDDDSSFPVQTQYRYTGQWFEDGLGASAENGLDRGLYFYNSRFYDPSLGRFIQPDTIVPKPGDPQQLNRYTYVNNRPTVFTDPTGHYIPIEGEPGDPDFIGVGGTDSKPIVFMPSNYIEAKWAEFFLAVMIGVDPTIAASRLNTRLNSWFGDVGDPTGAIEHSIWNQNPWVSEEVRDSWNQKTGGLQLLGATEVAYQGMQGQQRLGLRQQGQTNYFTYYTPIDPETYDYKKPPGPEWGWRGPLDKGSWYNAETKEYLRMDHSSWHDPHYDYRSPTGATYRIYLDGRLELKQGGR